MEKKIFLWNNKQQQQQQGKTTIRKKEMSKRKATSTADIDARQTQKHRRGARASHTAADDEIFESKTVGQTLWNLYKGAGAEGECPAEIAQAALDSMKEPVSATLRRAFPGKGELGNVITRLKAKSPPIMVVCASSNRACDLAREMKKAVDGLFVAKLFSRRMKVANQAKLLAGNSGGLVPAGGERPLG